MDAWILLLLTIFIGVIISLKTFGGAKGKLPPGPTPIPIVSRIQLIIRLSLFKIDPLLRNLRAKYGPIVALRTTSRPAIFIFDREVAHQALIQKGAAFSDRPAPSEGNRLFNSDGRSISSAAYGPLWRLLRRNLSSEILHPSRVKMFAQARGWVLGVLFAKLRSEAESGDGVVVVMEAFQYAMFCLLVLMCFGEKLDDKVVKEIESVQRYLLSSFLRFSVFAFRPRITKVVFRKRWNEMVATRRKQEEIFLPLIRARQLQREQSSGAPNGHEEGGDSSLYPYLDSLLDLQIPEENGRKLTDGEIVSLCSEFLNAGTDTTATALQWIMANLVKHPEIQRRLFEEINAVVNSDAGEVSEEDSQRMPYLKAVILEALRRHPPGHFVLPHRVTEEVDLNGYVIPRNASINFTVAEMGLDEKVWEDPREFRPERFLAGGEGEGVDITGSREIKMMPFGAGRRICPAFGLAMLHLEYFVANLVREFEWNAVDGEEVDLAEKLEFTVVMEKPLRARLAPRRRTK